MRAGGEGGVAAGAGAAALRRAADRRHDPARGADRGDAHGEGKTLVAVLPAYLNALSGKGVQARPARPVGPVHACSVPARRTAVRLQDDRAVSVEHLCFQSARVSLL